MSTSRHSMDKRENKADNTNMKVNIRQRREYLRLRQQDLANKVGIGRSTISDIETGKHIPSVDIAIKIAKILGCKVEDLFKL